jgi:acetyl-CoA carboxylase carboxyltransferase component
MQARNTVKNLTLDDRNARMGEIIAQVGRHHVARSGKLQLPSGAPPGGGRDGAVLTPTRHEEADDVLVEGATELRRRRERYYRPDPDGVARQRKRGLLLPRERIELLLDAESEWQYGYSLSHDGYVFGFGTVHGRPVAYRTWDPTTRGGAAGWAALRMSHQHTALLEMGALPLFNLTQSAGEEMTLSTLSSSFAGGFKGGLMGSRFAASRRGLVLTAVLGRSFAPWTASYSDFAVMTQDAAMAIVSPLIMEQATGAKVDIHEVGGSEVQARVTGQIDRVAPDEVAAIGMLRDLFAYLPSNVWERPPVVRNGDPVDRTAPELCSLVPAYPNKAYDMRKVVEAVVDRDSFVEWSPDFGRSVITGLARMDGETVGIVANQPAVQAGVINVASLTKARRLLRMLGEFGIPLVTFADTPGVFTTKEEEHRRLLAVATEFMVERLRAQVPKVCVVTGKAIGLAYFAMSGTDPEGITFAWPNAQISYIGPEGGVRVAYREELAAAEDPRALLDELAEPFRRAMNPWRGARTAGVDDIIDPAETRLHVVRALRALRRRGDAGRRHA